MGKIKFKEGEGSGFSAKKENQFWVCTRCGVRVVGKKCSSCGILKNSRSAKQKGADQARLWQEILDRKNKKKKRGRKK